nr:unnamed protein product [Spirometra erinaceieuropaei]
MGLFGHMRIHESGIDRPPDSPITPNPIPTYSPFASVPVIATDTDTTDFTCPHCPRTFTSRIGLVGHLRIHHTETGEPVPGAPTYTHRTRLHCPHCPRTFRHRMGLFSHMRIHDDLSRHLAQQRLREMQDAWMARKAEEMQGYADLNEWKNFFSAIKAVYGPPTEATEPLHNFDDSILFTGETQILERWVEQIRGIFNLWGWTPTSTSTSCPLSKKLSGRTTTLRQESFRIRAIPSEIYKRVGPQLMNHLMALFQEMRRQEEVPREFKDATIVHLYWRNGNHQLCDNHRGISLLNIAGNICARTLFNHLNNHLQQGLLPKSQCGFRRHRGITEMIIAVRQLQ